MIPKEGVGTAYDNPLGTMMIPDCTHPVAAQRANSYISAHFEVSQNLNGALAINIYTTIGSLESYNIYGGGYMIPKEIQSTEYMISDAITMPGIDSYTRGPRIELDYNHTRFASGAFDWVSPITTTINSGDSTIGGDYMIPKELTADRNLNIGQTMIPDVFQVWDYSLGIYWIFVMFGVWYESSNIEYGPFEFDQTLACTAYPQYFGGF